MTGNGRWVEPRRSSLLLVRAESAPTGFLDDGDRILVWVARRRTPRQQDADGTETHSDTP